MDNNKKEPFVQKDGDSYAPAKGQRQQPPKQIPSFRSQHSLVTFIVGVEPHQQTFVEKKAFVCYASPMISAAFNGKFKESHTQTMILPNVEPEIFAAFICYAYTGKYDDATHTLGIDQLVKLWILAESFLCNPLEALAFLGIYRSPAFRMADQVENVVEAVELVFGTDGDVTLTGMKKLFVDKMVYQSESALMKQAIQRFPRIVSDMLSLGAIEVAQLLRKAHNGMRPDIELKELKDYSYYHGT